MLGRRTILQGGLATAFAGMAGTASAQGFPNRPIRFVVPFAPGGGSDIAARLLSEELAQRLGQPLVIDNRPGMAASLGAGFMVREPADGYTILIATPGVQMTNPFLYPSLPYDSERDFAPIIHLAQLPNILVVHPSVPAQSVAELIAHARSRPGELAFSSTGPGSSSHLAAELFKSMAGIDMTHVPYRGSGPAVIDLVAGRVQVAIDSFTAMIQHVRQGSLRLLGISTPQRVPDYPDIPAIAETLPGYDGTTLLYMIARAGTPPEIVERYNAAFNEVLRIPRIRDRFRELGMIATGGSPQDLQAIIERDRAKWRRIIEISGARAE